MIQKLIEHRTKKLKWNKTQKEKCRGFLVLVLYN